MKRNRVTIRDVAKHAGVSHQTVSRVINQREIVSKETRELVQRSIDVLGYRPNAVARSLAAGRTFTLACIAPNLVDYTFAAIIEGAEQIARQNDYFLLSASAPTAAEFEALIDQLLKSRRVDGLLVVNPYIDDRIAFIPENFPTIFIGDDSNNENIPWVALDDEKAGYLATRHLIELGHKDILCIQGINTDACTQDRTGGYFRALQEANIPLNQARVLPGDWAATSAYEDVKSALQNGLSFTAVFAQNDRMAIGAIRALRDSGYHIPNDFSVIGIDDMPLASYFDPPLTTIQQDIYHIGQQAARMIIEKIDHPDQTIVSNRFPVKLIQRSSTAAIR